MAEIEEAWRRDMPDRMPVYAKPRLDPRVVRLECLRLAQDYMKGKVIKRGGSSVLDCAKQYSEFVFGAKEKEE